MNAPRPQNTVPPRAKGRRAPLPVLILDDERVDRYRLARLCSGLGFPCTVSNATTLQEFSDHLERNSFGLILIDFKLPDGTGIDALEMVRLSARNLNAPTLMVSGLTQEGIDEQARAAGCAGFLSKDELTAEHFTASVREILEVDDARPRSDQQVFSAEDVEKLLARANTKTVRDIKPMVSRLLRQMRDNRAGGRLPSDSGLVKLEENCMSLWLCLVEIERADAPVRLADLADTGLGHAPKIAKVKPGKPPSPFARLQH